MYMYMQHGISGQRTIQFRGIIYSTSMCPCLHMCLFEQVPETKEVHVHAGYISSTVLGEDAIQYVIYMIMYISDESMCFVYTQCRMYITCIYMSRAGLDCGCDGVRCCAKRPPTLFYINDPLFTPFAELLFFLGVLCTCTCMCVV